MSLTVLRALLVESDSAYATHLMGLLQQTRAAHVQVSRVENVVAAASLLLQEQFDVALVDLSGPSARLEPIWTLRREAPELAIVAMTREEDEDLGFQSVQAGAQDYVPKSTASEKGLVRTLRFAVERQRTLTEAMALSFLDTLTGLHNRRGFVALAEHHLRIASRSQHPMMVLFVDLDGLKQINDRLGHQHGDAAIAEAAAILRESFRETDLFARLGGDEFAVLAIEAPDQTSDILRHRLEEHVARHNGDGGRDYFISMSVGLAHFLPDAPRTVNQLLHEADRLMYAEKAGKKRTRA